MVGGDGKGAAVIQTVTVLWYKCAPMRTDMRAARSDWCSLFLWRAQEETYPYDGAGELRLARGRPEKLMAREILPRDGAGRDKAWLAWSSGKMCIRDRICSSDDCRRSIRSGTASRDAVSDMPKAP